MPFHYSNYIEMKEKESVNVLQFGPIDEKNTHTGIVRKFQQTATSEAVTKPSLSIRHIWFTLEETAVNEILHCDH